MSRLELTLIQPDGEAVTVACVREPHILDDEMWNFLKGAFVTLGWSSELVEEFFENEKEETRDEQGRRRAAD